jgi:hypothetical protein
LKPESVKEVRKSRESSCFFANQVPATLNAHPGRVDRSCLNVAVLSRPVRFGAAVHGQGHLAAQNGVRRSSSFSFIRPFCLLKVSLPRYFLLPPSVQKRRCPFRGDGGGREKGVPSSGEKIVPTQNLAKNRSRGNQFSAGGGA